MKKIMTAGGLAAACVLVAQQAPTADPGALKAKAYELYEQRRLPQAADQFRTYLERTPDDVRAQLDYAGLLSQLNRHADAARVLEQLRAKAPAHEGAHFKLAVEYAALERNAEAEQAFTTLPRSPNPEMARAATEALAQLRKDMAQAKLLRAQTRIFGLAREQKHKEVITAITELEKEVELSLTLEMQRLFAMSALRDYAVALEKADKLAQKHPNALELTLFRADMLAQAGRKLEAQALWRQIEQSFPGTAAASEATRRLQTEVTGPPPVEEKIYALARRQQHAEVIEAINELERSGKLSWAMEMQRLFAYQSLGRRAEALERAEKLSKDSPGNTDLALMRGDLLIGERRWQEAAAVLKQVKQDQPGTTAAAEAERRLQAIPPIANLDKWSWGEAYLSGDYHDRFGTWIGSGFLRHGWYVPGARWVQPYAEFRFSVDTKSGGTQERTTVADNYVGFYGGVRLQPFETEYLFVYAQGGTDKDLLDRRHNGDWEWDYQVGIYGFKSWGPGTVLHQTPAAADARYTNYVASMNDPSQRRYSDLFFYRGDWFVDVGADFSNYGRYDSWLGYAQAHEGLRLMQFGPNAAFDAYVVENIGWDVRGNYFDNLIEAGPGLRVLWRPHRQWEVVARVEWVKGWYMGRDSLNNRGTAENNYDDVRAGVSVGLRW